MKRDNKKGKQCKILHDRFDMGICMSRRSVSVGCKRQSLKGSNFIVVLVMTVVTDHQNTGYSLRKGNHADAIS